MHAILSDAQFTGGLGACGADSRIDYQSKQRLTEFFGPPMNPMDDTSRKAAGSSVSAIMMGVSVCSRFMKRCGSSGSNSSGNNSLLAAQDVLTRVGDMR